MNTEMTKCKKPTELRGLLGQLTLAAELFDAMSAPNGDTPAHLARYQKRREALANAIDNAREALGQKPVYRA